MGMTDQSHGFRDAVRVGRNRVRIPFFPIYTEVRHLLRIWPGFRRKQVTGFQSTLARLRGTPQNPVDWTHPESWIAERLRGDDRAFAQAVWKRSKGVVNPRHTHGHWLLAQKYDLLEDDSAPTLRLTPAGRDFLEEPGGMMESAIDGSEGIFRLLSIVADYGPAQFARFIGEWGDYLSRRSSFRADSTIRDTMRRRLRNLAERSLIERNGKLYSITQQGLEYLENSTSGDSVVGDTHRRIRALAREHLRTVRKELLESLLNMNPSALEQVVSRLLEEMGYRDVEVTSPTGDGGVDVIGEIELGITSIREVVQVKRHSKAIQRHVLDALRGSLYRFNAVRGTIITTSRFTTGTKSAAFATGAAPITLIDGDKLVDLLIEHGIGIRKRPIDLLEIDPDALASVEIDD